jgi:hypothetical protein
VSNHTAAVAVHRERLTHAGHVRVSRPVDKANIATTSIYCLAPLTPVKPSSTSRERVLTTGVVFAITDRMTYRSGYKYRVQWCDESDGFRWDDTWEHGLGLREDGLSSACDVVDAWKASCVPKFNSFCKLNGHVHHIGASPEGQCAFYAVGIAVAMLDNADWYSTRLVREFMDECAARERPISQDGVTYGELHRFVKFVTLRSSNQIGTRALDNNIFGGVCGKYAVDRLRALELSDGVCLCATFSFVRVGHCVVLRVTNQHKLDYDAETHGVEIIECDRNWIYGISCVRRVEIFSV